MSEYMAANRALWDEWAPIHERSEFYDVEGWKAGRHPLRDFVVDELPEPYDGKLPLMFSLKATKPAH